MQLCFEAQPTDALGRLFHFSCFLLMLSLFLSQFVCFSIYFLSFDYFLNFCFCLIMFFFVYSTFIIFCFFLSWEEEGRGKPKPQTGFLLWRGRGGRTRCNYPPKPQTSWGMGREEEGGEEERVMEEVTASPPQTQTQTSSSKPVSMKLLQL